MSEKLKKIRAKGMERALSLTKVLVTGTAKAGWNQIAKPFLNSTERTQAWEKYLLSQAQSLTAEMTRLKGSLMKAGQMLSMYGERILPPEVNRVLKTLQSNSLALEWNVIEKELIRELGPEKISELTIDPEPAGVASLGQVHAAKVKATGQKIALKVRYPGIDQAIESDLKWLKGLIKMAKFMPATPALDRVFEEARRMLHQEVDYVRERKMTSRFFHKLKNDSRYVVPQPVAHFCTPQIVATSFEEGLTLDDPQVQGLSPERRNRLGQAFLELYLKELFEIHMVQTDAHFGNFRIRLDPHGIDDKWVLFDFGAVRELDESFVSRYRALLIGALRADHDLTFKALFDLGMLEEGNETSEYAEILLSLCILCTEPVRFEGEYDWAGSDLPDRAAAYIPRLAFRKDLRLPPAEMLFLDRKVSGVYIMMAKLRVKIDARSLVARYLHLKKRT